ncbi:MAG: hypothetical protein ABI994_08160 [Gemmatimonadales bacterium]
MPIGSLSEFESGFGLYNQLLVHDHVQSLLSKLVTLIENAHGDFTCNTMLTLE